MDPSNPRYAWSTKAFGQPAAAFILDEQPTFGRREKTKMVRLRESEHQDYLCSNRVRYAAAGPFGTTVAIVSNGAGSSDLEGWQAQQAQSDTGLPLGDKAWAERLAKKRHLDLVIRPRGRPSKDKAKYIQSFCPKFRPAFVPGRTPV